MATNGFANSNKNFVQMLNPARAGNMALGAVSPSRIGSNSIISPLGAVGDQLGLNNTQQAILNPTGIIPSQALQTGQDFVQGKPLSSTQQLGAATVLGPGAFFTDQIQNTLGLGSRNTGGNIRESLFNNINDNLARNNVQLNTRSGNGRISDLRGGNQFTVTRDKDGNTTSGVRQQMQQMGISGDKSTRLRNVLGSFADFTGQSSSGGRGNIADTIMLELNGDEAEIKKLLQAQGADSDKLVAASLKEFKENKISGVELLESIRGINDFLGAAKDEGGELNNIINEISTNLIPEGGLDRFADGSLTEGAKKQLALRQVFGDDEIDVFSLSQQSPEIEQFLLNISDANGFKNQADLRKVDDKLLRTGLTAIAKASGKTIDIDKAIERINNGEIIINELDTTGVNLGSSSESVAPSNVTSEESKNNVAVAERSNLLDSITRVTSGNSLTKDKNPLDDIKYSIKVYEDKLKAAGISLTDDPAIVAAKEAYKRLSEDL